MEMMVRITISAARVKPSEEGGLIARHLPGECESRGESTLFAAGRPPGEWQAISLPSSGVRSEVVIRDIVER
jgi:hypothetical protein